VNFLARNGWPENLVSQFLLNHTFSNRLSQAVTNVISLPAGRSYLQAGCSVNNEIFFLLQGLVPSILRITPDTQTLTYIALDDRALDLFTSASISSWALFSGYLVDPLLLIYETTTAQLTWFQLNTYPRNGGQMCCPPSRICFTLYGVPGAFLSLDTTFFISRTYPMPAGCDYPFVIATDGIKLYSVTDTSPAIIVSFDLVSKTFSTYSLSPGEESPTACAYKDGCLYVLLNTTPPKLVKYDLAAHAHFTFDLIGDYFLPKLILPLPNSLYAATYIPPYKLLKIDPVTLAHNDFVLPPYLGLLTAAVYLNNSIWVGFDQDPSSLYYHFPAEL
jgi:hypothetical protein